MDFFITSIFALHVFPLLEYLWQRDASIRKHTLLYEGRWCSPALHCLTLLAPVQLSRPASNLTGDYTEVSIKDDWIFSRVGYKCTSNTRCSIKIALHHYPFKHTPLWCPALLPPTLRQGRGWGRVSTRVRISFKTCQVLAGVTLSHGQAATTRQSDPSTSRLLG